MSARLDVLPDGGEFAGSEASRPWKAEADEGNAADEGNIGGEEAVACGVNAQGRRCGTEKAGLTALHCCGE